MFVEDGLSCEKKKKNPPPLFHVRLRNRSDASTFETRYKLQFIIAVRLSPITLSSIILLKVDWCWTSHGVRTTALRSELLTPVIIEETQSPLLSMLSGLSENHFSHWMKTFHRSCCSFLRLGQITVFNEM